MPLQQEVSSAVLQAYVAVRHLRLNDLRLQFKASFMNDNCLKFIVIWLARSGSTALYSPASGSFPSRVSTFIAKHLDPVAQTPQTPQIDHMIFNHSVSEINGVYFSQQAETTAPRSTVKRHHCTSCSAMLAFLRLSQQALTSHECCSLCSVPRAPSHSTRM